MAEPAAESGAELAPLSQPEKRHWFDELDEIEWEDLDGDIERLPCSVGYVITCLLMPFFNGCINGFAASSVGLYFTDMERPLWHLGLALSLGFSMRLITQRLQVHFGIWTALPLAMFHLTGAILGVVFTAEEWAVFTEIVCLCAFDLSMAIEGIAYDSFKDFPEVSDMARQATSTSLGVFTVSIALACTVGGVLYDAYRWQGLSVFHCSCQGSLLLLLLISPTCRKSFMAYFFGDPDEEDDDEDDGGVTMKDLQVQPNVPNPSSAAKPSAQEIKKEAQALEQKLPGQSDLVVEDVEDPSRASKVSFSGAAPEAADAAPQDGEEKTPEAKEGKADASAENNRASEKSQKSRVTFGAEEVQAVSPAVSGTHDSAAIVMKAPDIPTAEGDAALATVDEGEIVTGVDYDQVDDLKMIFDQQDEDAMTPTSRMNVWNKKGHKKGLVLTNRIEGAVQHYEGTVGFRQIRINEEADEHHVIVQGRDPDPKRGSHYSGRGSLHSARASRLSRASRVSRASRASHVSSMSQASRLSAVSRVSRISRTSEATLRVARAARSKQRRASDWSLHSDESRTSRRSARTAQTTGTMRSNMTMRSQMTSLAEAGTNFEHHFMVNSTLGPQIVTKTGTDDVEDDFGEEEPPLEDVPWEAKGTIHADSKLPLVLICLCGLVNSYCYATEFGTFAVLYREYYGISNATTAALCQTAGDFVAALVMQINTFSGQFECCDSCLDIWHRLAFPPYNLSWALFIWILLSLAMISGVFPLAIIGQVLMSCTYCLTSKFSSELVFFYTRGDLKAFMKLQVYVKSSEALAAALANFLGLFLFELNPWLPYVICGCMAFVVSVIYTNIFCGRLSCRDIVVAEEKRLNAGT